MALAKAIQGGLRPVQVIVWSRGDSGIPENLTGATLTGWIRNTRTKVVRAITGTLIVTEPEAGAFTWSYSAADVADSGMFDVQFSAAYTNAPTPARSTPSHWLVEDALA